ncbi:hypothetical protein PoB_005205400 [Plakobranchus ocellatus]|uniref:Uncharacterized protein n=1 Tax=Plakobranchus ocellatus TaxID=259542 RepID=A0AAV4BZ92_9GAST|nr:hypothetical protein PoB_005205400 [Plakobranchus ocellatus]
MRGLEKHERQEEKAEQSTRLTFATLINIILHPEEVQSFSRRPSQSGGRQTDSKVPLAAARQTTVSLATTLETRVFLAAAILTRVFLG